MALQHTVDHLIEQVRSKLDLAANEAADDTSDILPALNRAKDYAFDILSRMYKEPLLTYATVSITAGDSEYEMPDDVFEDRLLKVEWQKTPGATYEPLDRLSYQQVHAYETQGAGIPSYYCVVGRTYQLVPQPQSGTVRIWYLRCPQDYVKSLGRITAVDAASSLITLDSINSSLTTSTAALGAYVNIVDAVTGAVKYSVQIKTIDEDNNQIEIKSSPARSSVLGRTIESSLVDLDISEDDHICAINGTCIPFFRTPVSNFCIEYATAEMKDKLERKGSELAHTVLQKFEEQVERTWVAREGTRRVKRSNTIWAPSTGNFFLRTR